MRHRAVSVTPRFWPGEGGLAALVASEDFLQGSEQLDSRGALLVLESVHGLCQAGDDIGWGIWGLEKLLSSMLAAPGRTLSRQTFVSAPMGKAFTTGVWPTVKYGPSRFGGTAVHVLRLDCSKQQYVTEQMNRNSF